MQSWSVDAFSDQRLFLEATATPVAFGAHLGGVGAELQERIARYEHLAVIGVHLSERASGRVTLDRRGRLRIRHHLCANDAQTLRFGIARAAEIHVAAGAREVYPPIAHLGALSGDGLDCIERTRVRPGQLRLEAFHPMGTAGWTRTHAAGLSRRRGRRTTCRACTSPTRASFQRRWGSTQCSRSWPVRAVWRPNWHRD